MKSNTKKKNDAKPKGMYWINSDAMFLIHSIAERDMVSKADVVNQCALIGADFLSSPYWGELISEYYEATGSFNWDGFLSWSFKKIYDK